MRLLFVLFFTTFSVQLGKCFRICGFQRDVFRIGVIYSLPSGRKVCVHLKDRESDDHPMIDYYYVDQKGVTQTGLATMAVNGANEAMISTNNLLRFNPLAGISRARMILATTLKTVAYSNIYDETYNGGFLAYKTNFEELEPKHYTSEQGEYCTIEESANGKRAKLCYRIGECDYPYRPMSARSVGHVFEFASWYKRTRGEDLVLKLNYDDEDPKYVNGQIVESRAAFLVFNKTTVRQDYVVYVYACSMMVEGLPDWALTDLAQHVSTSSWKPGDPILPATPKKSPTIPRLCYQVLEAPATEKPEATTTTENSTTSTKPTTTETSTSTTSKSATTEKPTSTKPTTTEKPSTEKSTSTNLTTTENSTISTTSKPTTTEKPSTEKSNSTTSKLTTTEDGDTSTTTEPKITNDSSNGSEISVSSNGSDFSDSLNGFKILYTDKVSDVTFDVVTPHAKLNNRVETKFNQIRKNGMNVDSDEVDTSSLIPGLEDRFLYFLIGFMGVLIIAMCVGMVAHFELRHR